MWLWIVLLAGYVAVGFTVYCAVRAYWMGEYHDVADEMKIEIMVVSVVAGVVWPPFLLIAGPDVVTGAHGLRWR